MWHWYRNSDQELEASTTEIICGKFPMNWSPWTALDSVLIKDIPMVLHKQHTTVWTAAWLLTESTEKYCWD